MEPLQTACLSLLFSTQAHPVGFARLDVPDPASLAALLSEPERRLLDLYDRLRRLSLEKRVLEALEDGEDDTQEDEPRPTLEELEQTLVHAQAERSLKETVVDMALTARPVLKAVHEAATNSPRERALFPLVQRRDTLSLTHASLSHVLQTLSTQLSATETAYRAAQEVNRDLAQRMLAVAAERKAEARANRGEEYKEAVRELRETRVRWDIMRNVVQAVVVGSGVDWCRDERLCAVVLACGEEV